MKIKRNRNATITDIRIAWFRRKVAELGKLLQQLPADRREMVDAEILAQPQSTNKGTQAK